MTEPTTTIIDQGAPNTESVKRDLQNELAAVTSAWFATRLEKKTADKAFNEELGELEERMEDLIGEIKAGGTQLVMHFGSVEEGNQRDRKWYDEGEAGESADAEADDEVDDLDAEEADLED